MRAALGNLADSHAWPHLGASERAHRGTGHACPLCGRRVPDHAPRASRRKPRLRHDGVRVDGVEARDSRACRAGTLARGARSRSHALVRAGRRARRAPRARARDLTRHDESFGNYIARFSGGYFILKANYYKAECDFKNKSYDSSLVNYEFVSAYNRNDFTERSTRQCAVLYFMKKNYDKAFDYYSALEKIASGSDNISVALLGQMKTSELLNKIDTAAASSFKYLNSTLTQKEGTVDAHLNIARYYMLHNMADSALPHFKFIIKETRNAQGAESKYNVAVIQYMNKDYKASKKTVYDLSDNYSSYETWTAKGFILLSDIYIAQKDNFQAKATLQSVIDNADDESIKNKARTKLRLIIDNEEKLKTPAKTDEEKEIGQ